MVDGLEHRGLVERRVADYDRRIKTVELTDEGVAARERALDAVYGPRAGFAALSPTERATLARLLRKMADAQASYDEELLDKPQVRADMRWLAQQRIREFGAVVAAVDAVVPEATCMAGGGSSSSSAKSCCGSAMSSTASGPR